MKPASLSASLLARKGSALPSVLSPSRILERGAPAQRNVANLFAAGNGRTARPRHDGDAERASRGGGGETAARTEAARVKLSIRLDPERHLRLKLAAAHTGRRLQDIVVAALDRYLDDMSEIVQARGCDCYRSHAPRPAAEAADGGDSSDACRSEATE